MMIFAQEPGVVAQWWADLLECPVDRVAFVDGFAWFDVGDIEFGFHLADASKNPVSGSPVVHLRVEDLAAASARAESKGARLHRGPLAVESSRSITQLVDPFGNVFGLDGPQGPSVAATDQFHWETALVRGLPRLLRRPFDVWLRESVRSPVGELDA